MSRKVLDIETSGLLSDLLDYSSLPYKLKPTAKLWMLVVRDVDTNAVEALVGSGCTKANLQKALEGCTELIGHNLVAFDLPMLSLFGILDYRIGYPGEPSTIFAKPCTITDTMLWSKLMNPDRFGGHSLKEWGKRTGEFKGEHNDWSRYSVEMEEYCKQDTLTTAKTYEQLLKEKACHNGWDSPYLMELKLQDLTLKQEHFGFAFDRELAEVNVKDLQSKMQVIAAAVDPILPEKRLTQVELKSYTLPKIRYKKDGTYSSHLLKFVEKVGATLQNGVISYKGKEYPCNYEKPLQETKPATIEDIETVKGYLLSLGWEPSEIKERDLVKNTDKSIRDYSQTVEAIDRYVKKLENSEFRELTCSILGVSFSSVRQLLVSKIDGAKPIYVPTSPRLTVGLEKELCRDLVRLGEQAKFAKDVADYYTYRHRKNSIAGGATDEDGEPVTGFISAAREDGRIPTPADILGANTGRYRHKIVCNIPRVSSLYGGKMRAMFGAGDGFVQLGYDFASLEARIMGHYVIPFTDGKQLAESLLAKKPLDLHSLNATKLGISRDEAKNFSYACLPMSTQVLTTSGWKNFKDIKQGDSVLSFNAEKDRLEPDAVLKTHFFKNKEIFKYFNSHKEFYCTEDHRWYGWRRSKTRGKPSKRVFGYFEAKDFTTEHNIVTTAPYVGGSSGISPDEARLLGWILSEGTIKWAKESMRTSACKGLKRGCDVRITQSLNYFCEDIENTCNKLGAGYNKYLQTDSKNPVFVYRLESSFARDFLDKVLVHRDDKHNINYEPIILSLSYPALESFCESFFLGNGHKSPRAKHVTQNKGKILDAVALAYFLIGSGNLSFSSKGFNRKSTHECFTMSISKKRNVGLIKMKKESQGVQDSFCLTTKNGSFVIKQGDFISITGNCMYGAQPKKLAKMLRITEAKAKKLYEDYWNAVPALKELKQRAEQVWEKNNKEAIPGIDGRLLKTRSKHSLVNILFQSGGAIAVKNAIVLQCKFLEEKGLLGNPFVNTPEDVVAWLMTVMHDEAQIATHPNLLTIKRFSSEAEALAYTKENQTSAVSRKSTKFFLAANNPIQSCIQESITLAAQQLKLRVELGYEWKIGDTWEMCH